MSLIQANKAYVQINAVDLSAWVTRLDVNLKGYSLVDVTAMGDLGRTWVADRISEVTMTMDFLYDNDAAGPWRTLEVLWDSNAYFDIYVDLLQPAGLPTITGNGWLDGGLPIQLAIGDMIRLAGVAFKFDGVPTITPA